MSARRLPPVPSRLALGASVLALCVASACADNGPPSRGLDAGPAPPDAGDDAAVGPPPDGGPGDAGSPDAGDGGPACGCPPLPDTCTAPSAGTPAFTPDDGTYGEQLIGLIACADRTIRAALYETTDPCVVNALAERLRANPDVVIELVIDDAQCPRTGGVLDCPLSALDSDPRVTIVDDARSRLMHHKFVSVDARWVWVSSGNMTRRSRCTDFNNAIIVDQPEIVVGYEQQFDHLFTLRAFGPVAATDPVRGGPYALYFSPETPIDSPSRWFTDMLAALDGATTSVEFMISAFTRAEVSDAMIAAAGRGVAVRGVVSGAYADDAPALALLAAGIPVRVDNVHSKLLIVDGRLVMTGSPNWSQASWANNENQLWIDDAAIAGTYAAELAAVFEAASVP